MKKFSSGSEVLSGSRLSRRRIILTVMLLLLLPASALHATCRCGAGSLEVVLVMDTTSSMHVMIGTVKEQLYRLIAALEGSTEQLRVGAVLYRSPEAPEYVVKSHPLTADRADLVKWIRTASVRGGGHEAVEAGLAEAIEGMSWTKGSRKVVILVGDEAPHPSNRTRCLKLARLAKSRGISVNTITASMTAWTYWQLTNREEWQKMLRLRGERAKSEFVLPIFKDIAAQGGGISVPSRDTRELLKWLLVIASGADETKVDFKKFMDWEPAAGKSSPGEQPMLGHLKHGGHWNPPRNFETLRQALAGRVRLQFDSARVVVAADSAALGQYPLLYLTGHGAISFSPAEKAGLKRYLSNGGLLWADNCCGNPGFDRSLKRLMTGLFPGSSLHPLAPDHPVYRSGFQINNISYAVKPRSGDGRLRSGPPDLQGLLVGGRLAVIYSPSSLGCGWASYPMGRTCCIADPDAVRLSLNILLYALTTPVKQTAE